MYLGNIHVCAFWHLFASVSFIFKKHTDKSHKRHFKLIYDYFIRYKSCYFCLSCYSTQTPLTPLHNLFKSFEWTHLLHWSRPRTSHLLITVPVLYQQVLCSQSPKQFIFSILHPTLEASMFSRLISITFFSNTQVRHYYRFCRLKNYKMTKT